MSTNLGFLARFPEGSVQNQCKRTFAEITEGHPQIDVLYVIQLKEYTDEQEFLSADLDVILAAEGENDGNPD